jgi:hypothetical protein
MHALPPHDRGTCRTHARSLYLNLSRPARFRDFLIRNLGRPATRASTLGLPVRHGADLDRFLVRDAIHLINKLSKLSQSCYGVSATHVCVECLIGKQKKPILCKVTEPSSVPYRAPSAWPKWRHCDPSGSCVECLIGKQKKPILFKVTEPSSIPQISFGTRFSKFTN